MSIKNKLSISEFTSPGYATVNVPANANRMTVLVVGAGGGGAGASKAKKPGGGGGAGGFFYASDVPVTGGGTISFTIGSKGLPGVGNSNGSDGGDSSITIPNVGTYTGKGGKGGICANVDALGAGGVGGLGVTIDSTTTVLGTTTQGRDGSAGDLSISGGNGAIAAGTDVFFFTTLGIGGISDNGQDGKYGGGGGGAGAHYLNDVTYSGGYGGDGFIRIIFYATTTGVISSVEYTVAGNYTINVPANANKARVIMIGGGGGGSGAMYTSVESKSSYGAGGGAGGYMDEEFTVPANGTMSLVVGKGGKGSVAGSKDYIVAGTGGSTILTAFGITYTCYGGGGAANAMGDYPNNILEGRGKVGTGGKGVTGTGNSGYVRSYQDPTGGASYYQTRFGLSTTVPWTGGHGVVNSNNNAQPGLRGGGGGGGMWRQDVGISVDGGDGGTGYALIQFYSASMGNMQMTDIVTEFTGTKPYKLSAYYRGAGKVPNTAANSGIPTAGTIKFSDFYGAIRYVPAGTNGVVYFTTPGTYSWTIPTSSTEIEITVIGAGGGGSGGGGDSGDAGVGGYPGGAAIKTYPVDGGTVLTVTVGLGGAGGSGVYSGSNSMSYSAYGKPGGTSAVTGPGINVSASGGGYQTKDGPGSGGYYTWVNQAGPTASNSYYTTLFGVNTYGGPGYCVDVTQQTLVWNEGSGYSMQDVIVKKARPAGDGIYGGGGGPGAAWHTCGDNGAGGKGGDGWIRIKY